MKLKRAFLILTAAVILFSAAACGNNGLRKIYSAAEETLLEQKENCVGSVGGEWRIIGLARSEKLTEEAADEYLKNAAEYIENIGKDRIDDVKSTENSRLILGVSAAGGDPLNIGGRNLVAGLSDMSYIEGQGINGAVWALIAFDCKKFDIPQCAKEEETVTREKLVSCILQAQSEDGGFGLIKDSSDVDLTAMALQALALYKKEGEVETAIERALVYLSKIQLKDGGYESYGTANSESCSQVAVALMSLGIDIEKDERFIKNGKNVIDALSGFAVEKGFCHQKEKLVYDAMATEQAYYAITAYYRFKENKAPLYDFT